MLKVAGQQVVMNVILTNAEFGEVFSSQNPCPFLCLIIVSRHK